MSEPRLFNVTDVAAVSPAKLGDFRELSTNGDDYSYDDNGNLTKDNNKNITSITYNHLNLPSVITFTGSRSISYVYDAGGQKLKKIVTEGSTVTTTLYLFGTYPNNVLDFLPMEEGRIRSTLYDPTGFTYDYLLKDHLGNVRIVLTEEVKPTMYEALTFKDQNSTQQNEHWDNKNGGSIDIQSVRTTKPSNFNGGGGYARSVSTATTSIGAAKFLKVMAGDRIHTQVDYYYTTTNATNSNSSPIASIINGLIITFGGSAATSPVLHGNSTALSNQLSGNTALSSFVNPSPSLNPNNASEQAPKAYLCVLFFDEQFRFDDAHSYVEKVQYTASGGQISRMSQNAIPVVKSGYAYVYFTNESSDAVYIDNFLLTHERGPLLEETHYYPFGLVMAGISSKAAGGILNRKKFNSGNELQTDEFSDNSGLEWLDAVNRMYDPQLGRFWQIDELAEATWEESPYTFAHNNPILYNDPLGLTPDDPGTPGSSPENRNVLPTVTVIAIKGGFWAWTRFYYKVREWTGGDFSLVKNDYIREKMYRFDAIDKHRERVAAMTRASDKIFLEAASWFIPAGAIAKVRYLRYAATLFQWQRGRILTKITNEVTEQVVAHGNSVASRVSEMSFEELQTLAKSSSKELNAFFKSNGEIVPEREVLEAYKELATRIVTSTGVATAKQTTETAIKVQSQRIDIINKVLNP